MHVCTVTLSSTPVYPQAADVIKAVIACNGLTAASELMRILSEAVESNDLLYSSLAIKLLLAFCCLMLVFMPSVE